MLIEYWYLLRSTGDGRAWLLPLLRDHIQNTSLAYFIQNLLPMSEKLVQKSIEFQSKNRMIEAKVYETLTQQVWSLLPGFCNLPYDLPQVNIVHKYINIIFKWDIDLVCRVVRKTRHSQKKRRKC